MKRLRTIKWSGLLAAAMLLLPADRALACASCFGQSDSPLAEGMNWGIFSLLAIVVCVLSGIGAFFIFLAKRAAAEAIIGSDT